MLDALLPDGSRTADASPASTWLRRWRGVWDGSLRFRLLALGLMPLLVAFPLVIVILVVVGGERANSLLSSNLQSNLTGASNYLQQLKSQSGTRVVQLARSERLIQLIENPADAQELGRHLRTAAEGAGLDFLVVTAGDGTVLGSSTGVAPGVRMADSHVIRQARIGVASAAYERFDAAQLAAFSPAFAEQARVPLQAARPPGAQAETRGLLINAAAHFPLSVRAPDVILVGGVLLNRNFPLIEHMREILYPLGSLPGDAEGMTCVHIDGVSVATSRQRLQGQRAVGTRAAPEAEARVLGRGEAWLGRLDIGGTSYMTGYAPIEDGDGRRIGLISVGFPDAPYQRMTWLLLGMIAALMALTLLAISVVFLRAGRELTQRLARIADTMSAVRQGNRRARVGVPLRDDELGRLAQHFDVLLETIDEQDARQRVAQQAIADEASRRRALFENERDGVVILNADGSVFEANPKFSAMLGYAAEELQRLRLHDWDERLTRSDINQLLDHVGPEGSFFETVHRRRDGSTYAAEVSVSRAQWGEQAFVFLLQRDISERKAVEAELERYRAALESLVSERTQELNDRSEQLAAIFALSPDGFVSFDAERRVGFANRAFLRLAGWELNEVVGLDEITFSAQLAGRCRTAAPFPGVPMLRAARRQVDDAGPARGGGVDPGSVQEVEQREIFELVSPGHRVVEVGIRLSHAENVSQVLYFRDVTQETEVDRMKSEFLTTAAHELRTPMTSIYGFVNLLRLRPFDEARRKDILTTVAQQSELMIAIINQLLDLARIESRRGQDFVIELVTLQEVVDAVLAGYQLPAGREAPRQQRQGPALCTLADRQKMQQALLNIVANAYKYSPGAGPVEISFLGEAEPAAASAPSAAAGPRRVGVRVRDHGIGMTAEQRSHVCERFYRADASGNIPGTGLGMSIVKEIVELHGGTVEIDSAPGVGTEVTLWFPAARDLP